MKTLAVSHLSTLFLACFFLAAPAQGDAPLVSEKEWGVYADLAGTAWSGDEWRITVEWREIGAELVETWDYTGGRGGGKMTNVITRGDQLGALRLASTHSSCAKRTGAVRPDGSVLFRCDGFLKFPTQVVSPERGVLEHRWVGMSGDEIASVKRAVRLREEVGAGADASRVASRTADQAPSAALAIEPSTSVEVRGGEPTPAQATVAAPEPVSPLAADWGVYAAIVDKDWRGASNVSIRWNKPGEELVEKWTYGVERGERAGEQQLVAIIRRGEKPGSLVVTLEVGEVNGARTLVGKVREDGSVQFSRPGLILDSPAHTVSLPSSSRLVYRSFPLAHDVQTTLYLASDDGEHRGSRQQLRETWGLYADLAGKHWRLIDDEVKRLLRFDWIVPGEAMYVRTHILVYDREYTYHVVRSPETGKLYAEASLWGDWKAEVTLDGDRSIELETKGMLGWRESFTRKADGGFEFYEDRFGQRPYTGSMVPMSRDEAPRLIAAAKEAKAQEKQQRKRERREAFNSAMMVANAALVATSETLAQQQAEADAAQRRYQTAVMEQNRVAAEREEAERKYQADRQRARQVLADRERAREARAETSRTEAARRQEGMAQSAQHKQQQQQQRRAEDTRRRDAADAERKRQQEAEQARRADAAARQKREAEETERQAVQAHWAMAREEAIRKSYGLADPGDSKVSADLPEKKSAAPSEKARAWCQQNKYGKFGCYGPLQTVSGYDSLEAALSMAGCSKGEGYRPARGGSGTSFDCQRDLKKNEKRMPLYDPFAGQSR